MKNVIIGTAGHVDHGKTTLIQALTGTNPDRLKEEQERGMTIDIGFAALRLPDGTIAGIVDVPGHERFLKNMLAGASGIDVALLVIAADEGVMPQTREHLEILRLLDIQNGVVALTKIDIVEKEWTDAIEEDVRLHLKDTFLESSPFIRVSAATGKGIDALKRALLSASSRARGRSTTLPFRLPVDRVFIRPGFGTVVTGTLVAGTIRAGDTVEIVPQGITTRVRGIQVHGQKQKEAQAGARVAVNLPGVEVSDIARGAQLAPPGTLLPTTTFDSVLQLLPTAAKALEDRTRVRLHLGTEEVLGRVRLLDGNSKMEPGQRSFIQFRGETEFACARGDRFVIRTYSPSVTIGGGAVLEAHPKRHRKDDADVLASLASRESGAPSDILETNLQAFPTGIFRKDLIAASGIAEADATAAIESLIAQALAVKLPGDRLIHPSQLSAAADRVVAALQKYHAQFPLRRGMPKEELRGVLGKNFDPRTFQALSSYWQSHKTLVIDGATANLPEFEVELNERQRGLLTRIEDFYRSKGIATPTIDEVTRWVKAPPDAIEALLHVGVERGRFAPIEAGVYYHVDTLAELKNLLSDYLSNHPSITVAAFRDLTQSNRKFALLLLEYLDQMRFTRREGDERTLFTP